MISVIFLWGWLIFLPIHDWWIFFANQWDWYIFLPIYDWWTFLAALILVDFSVISVRLVNFSANPWLVDFPCNSVRLLELLHVVASFWLVQTSQNPGSNYRCHNFISANIFCNFNKYISQFGKIHFVFWSNIFQTMEAFPIQ